MYKIAYVQDFIDDLLMARYFFMQRCIIICEMIKVVTKLQVMH